MNRSTQPGTWDEPWYRVRTEHFEAAFLGEALGGCYFWVSDGLVVRDAGISNMTQVLNGLIETDEFRRILRRVDG